MQLAIELPDELAETLDLKQLAKEFVEFVLSKNKSSSEESHNEKTTISPITQSLIGLLASSKFDEVDYKKHLEDKYL